MYREFTAEVHRYYFGNKTIDQRVKCQYLDMYNDMLMIYPIYRAMQYHLEFSTGKTYYFQ